VTGSRKLITIKEALTLIGDNIKGLSERELKELQEDIQLDRCNDYDELNLEMMIKTELKMKVSIVK
jgi:hypothetical protein